MESEDKKPLLRRVVEYILRKVCRPKVTVDMMWSKGVVLHEEPFPKGVRIPNKGEFVVIGSMCGYVRNIQTCVFNETVPVVFITIHIDVEEDDYKAKG